VTVHSGSMPKGFGWGGKKQNGTPLATMLQLKRSIVEVGDEENCIVHAFIIAIARLNNDPNYKASSKVVRYVLWSAK